MKNEYDHTKRHRGSSPLSQGEGRGFHSWLKNLKLIDQNSDDILETESQKQERFKEAQSNSRKVNSRQTKEIDPDHESCNKNRAQQDKNDEARWQDDGGEG